MYADRSFRVCRAAARPVGTSVLTRCGNFLNDGGPSNQKR